MRKIDFKRPDRKEERVESDPRRGEERCRSI